jgi:hypothetical protein
MVYQLIARLKLRDLPDPACLRAWAALELPPLRVSGELLVYIGIC